MYVHLHVLCVHVLYAHSCMYCVTCVVSYVFLIQSLLGTFSSTGSPGQFKWEEGVLTKVSFSLLWWK